MTTQKPSEFDILREQFKRNAGPIAKFILPGFFILMVFALANTLYYTVQPDEEAVITRFGRYQGTYGPGLHFKIPFGVDRLHIVKTTLIHQAEFGFRTQDIVRTRTQYSKRGFGEESLMLTGDLNVADVEWVVQYKISDPYKYLFQAKSPIKNIRDISESIMRRVVGDRLVTDVLTTGRAEIGSSAIKLMQEVLDKYDMGINVVTVKLQDVNPPDRVKPSFNEVNEAKQEQEKLINQAEKTYNKVIPEAKGKAEKLISEAEGYATSLVNRADGDAQKFTAILKEYRKAPAITRKRLYIETMERLFSRFDDITIVDEKVKGLLPIYQRGKTNE